MNSEAIIAEARSSDELVSLVGKRRFSGEALIVGCIYLVESGGVTLLAEPESARSDLYGIAARYGSRIAYPPAVADEVGDWLSRPGIDDPALDDLTGLAFVTIDNEGSRDLDQALFVERDGDARVIRYALADASYYVRPGMALFEEALLRGVTDYLPGLAFPMLPSQFSEGLVSLNPGVERRAVVLHMRVESDGRCSETHVSRARIRSRAKLTYGGVQEYFDDPARRPVGGPEVEASLNNFRDVGLVRMEEARRRDVVQYQRKQVEISIPHKGQYRFGLTGDERNMTERYNEQVSLLCNMEGARLLAEAGANAIWRVHPAPPGERLEALGRLAAGVARVHGLDLSWTPRHLGGSSVSELLDTVRRVAPTGVQQAIERAAMISNVRSTFTPEHGPHHGVGAEGYARVSSPMREIVGVFTHALLLHSQGLESWEATPDDSLRDAVARAGNEGQSRQRRLAKAANRLVLDWFFERDLRDDDRPWRAGFVVELRPSRVYVLLDEPPFEVKVYGSDLGSQSRLDQDGALLRLKGGDAAQVTELLLGQRVELRTARLEQERWRFALRVGHEG